MSRVVCAVLLVCLAALTHAQSQPPDPPTEVDTVHVGRSVVLSSVRGEILKKGEGGALRQVTSGECIKPGDVLLVRKGASFSIGRTTFGPESHGDRWVQFQ